MTTFERILVPVDLSSRSLGAAEYAAGVAHALGSEVLFLHSIDTRWPLADEQKEMRSRILRMLRKFPGRFLMREGDPATVILNAAGEERADMILMPAPAANPVRRLLGRSVTARVMRGARQPVWTGVDDAPAVSGKPIRNVLCGLSLGPRTGGVLAWAAAVARRLRAKLTVIHTSPALRASPGAPCDQEWRLWLKKLATEDIRNIQHGAETDAEVWVEEGTPLAAIPPLAERLRADLLVIGKSPPPLLWGGLGKLSYDLVRRAPCPVAAV